MNYEKEFQKMLLLIEKANHILIIPHIDPDPDALCSSFALSLALEQLGKICHVGLQEELEANSRYLAPDDCLITLSEIADPPYDLIITVDIGSKKRTGKYFYILDKEVDVINLDHHADNDLFGTVFIVDASRSSTCEIVFDFLEYMKTPLNYEIALVLYTGIVYDTGSFRYNLTSSRTHFIVSEMLKFDIDTNEVFENLFENVTQAGLCLKNKVAETLELFKEGKVALTYFRQSFYDECCADETDKSSFVKIGSSIKGVRFSIFMTEKGDVIKVSLRSKGNFKVNLIANQFGGGGHDKASGFALNKTFEEAKKIIINEVIPTFSE